MVLQAGRQAGRQRVVVLRKGGFVSVQFDVVSPFPQGAIMHAYDEIMPKLYAFPFMGGKRDVS